MTPLTQLLTLTEERPNALNDNDPPAKMAEVNFIADTNDTNAVLDILLIWSQRSDLNR
ncbi:hypothetical protein [Deinococcus sp.]|uniref:hypothetical protein n=1 Tax=Deinococcus sp. TaxID=47478 RepID=UPI003B5A8333